MLPELRQLTTFNPATFAPETPLEEVLWALAFQGVRHWPVIDDAGRVVGMLSDIDVLRAVEERYAVALSIGADALSRDCWLTCQVSDLMRPPDFVVQHSASAEFVLARMVEENWRSLPVVESGTLIGVITANDFLRELSYGSLPCASDPAADYVARGRDTLEYDCSLEEAWGELLLAQGDCLPVTRGGCPMGVVSRRDVRMAKVRQSLREVRPDLNLGEGPASVAELVANAPLLPPGLRLSQATAFLLEHQREAAAVVNQAQRMLGYLDEQEILRAMLQHVRTRGQRNFAY